MATRAATYTHREVPATYDQEFLRAEFQNIQRALPGTVIRTTTVNDSQRVTDRTIKVDATNGNLTFALLVPSLSPTFPITVLKRNAGGNTVTIIGTVSGQVNPVLAQQWTSLTMQSDGVEWVII